MTKLCKGGVLIPTTPQTDLPVDLKFGKTTQLVRVYEVHKGS
jgi:hypothetical protein